MLKNIQEERLITAFAEISFLLRIAKESRSLFAFKGPSGESYTFTTLPVP